MPLMCQSWIPIFHVSILLITLYVPVSSSTPDASFVCSKLLKLCKVHAYFSASTSKATGKILVAFRAGQCVVKLPQGKFSSVWMD